MTEMRMGVDGSECLYYLFGRRDWPCYYDVHHHQR